MPEESTDYEVNDGLPPESKHDPDDDAAEEDD